MKPMMKEFTHYLVDKIQLSENTIQSYHLDLNKFFDYLSDRSIKTVEEVSAADIYAYRVHLKEQKLKNTTINRYLASLRRYFSYLHHHQWIDSNPTVEIRGLAAKKKKPSTLSEETILDLLERRGKSDLLSLRDEAIIELIYATGMKATEVVALEGRHLDPQTGELTCQDRIFFLPTQVLEKCQKYLGARGGDEDGPLFQNYQGSRLTRQSLWKITKEWGEKQGLDASLTPNVLRSSLKEHLEDRRAPRVLIDHLMGYETEDLRLDALKDSYKRYHPRA